MSEVPVSKTAIGVFEPGTLDEPSLAVRPFTIIPSIGIFQKSYMSAERLFGKTGRYCRAAGSVTMGSCWPE